MKNIRFFVFLYLFLINSTFEQILNFYIKFEQGITIQILNIDYLFKR